MLRLRSFAIALTGLAAAGTLSCADGSAPDALAVAFAGRKAGWLVGTDGRILKITF